ncbi:O-antigen ligase family protein [Herbaspirillum autotrophicum]|uniref:O-antigen ligase family protein n=1 Tax=Herbaspirillum autotrophicum TaxID=180195 RepID=UPI00067D0B78|nr:O-antigen ligase family protein [Herbaspirillum autotrophicum]
MIGYTSFAVFLFFAISLIIPSGFSVGATALLLGGLVLFRRDVRLRLDSEDRLLIAVLLFYFVVAVIMNLIHGEIIKEYDLPLRFLLAIPALLVLRVYPPTPRYFWAGLAIGGILAGLFTGWQNLFVLHGRANGYTNAIQYGNISFIIGMLCLAGLGWAKEQSRANVWVLFLIVGAVMGMLGSMFTGSRGSWVGLPVCLYLLYRCYGGTISKRYLVGIISALVVICAVIYMIPRTDVKARVQLAFAEAQDYAKTRNADSSIGTRMEMWRAGALAAQERPLLGWGKAGFVVRETELINEGKVSPLMKDNNHVYNEWLDAIVKRGVPGLLVLLALYLVPLYLFAGYLRRGSAAQRPYALCGLMLIVCYIGFGFSQVFMAHNTGVMTLGFTLVILWGLLKAEERPFA